MKLRLSDLSLTELSSAGLAKMSEASSAMSDMLLPPKAVAWAETGSSRKLNTVLLSWACTVAANRRHKADGIFFIIADFDVKDTYFSGFRLHPCDKSSRGVYNSYNAGMCVLGCGAQKNVQMEKKSGKAYEI